MGACVSCHTLQRVFASTHDPEEFKALFKRMGALLAGQHADRICSRCCRGRAPTARRYRRTQFDAQSNWLASVNLSTTDHWTFDLKTLPRPTGASTKVIITEYDLPRKETQPHDVIVDQDGQVWYSDFSNMYRRRARSQDRQGDRHPDPGAQARGAQGQPRDRARARPEERLARPDVPGRRRADRSQDPRGADLSVPEGMGFDHRAGLDGLAAALRRRRQGVDQQSRRAPHVPDRREDRSVREYGAVH